MKYQNTPEYIKAILSHTTKMYFIDFQVCASSKTPLVSEFKFH